MPLGLRNPQELAFDECGNLFTVDNNSDAGDKVRCVYVVEGGDSGWRIGFQWGTATGVRGPWMAEKMDDPQWDGQAEFLVPPVANLANGPSGLTYYPGLGLPAALQQTLFLVRFPRLQRRQRRPLLRLQAERSDVQDGRSASIHLVGAWDRRGFRHATAPSMCPIGSKAGRSRTKAASGRSPIPNWQNSPAVLEVQKIMAEGFKNRSTAELSCAAAKQGHACASIGSVRIGGEGKRVDSGVRRRRAGEQGSPGSLPCDMGIGPDRP